MQCLAIHNIKFSKLLCVQSRRLRTGRRPWFSLLLWILRLTFVTLKRYQRDFEPDPIYKNLFFFLPRSWFRAAHPSTAWPSWTTSTTTASTGTTWPATTGSPSSARRTTRYSNTSDTRTPTSEFEQATFNVTGVVKRYFGVPKLVPCSITTSLEHALTNPIADTLATRHSYGQKLKYYVSQKNISRLSKTRNNWISKVSS